MTRTRRKRISKVFFLGTPLAASKPKDFAKAVRACVSQELGLERLRKPQVDEQVLDNFLELLLLLQSVEFQIVSFYETNESKLGTILHFDSKAKIVCKLENA